MQTVPLRSWVVCVQYLDVSVLARFWLPLTNFRRPSDQTAFDGSSALARYTSLAGRTLLPQLQGPRQTSSVLVYEIFTSGNLYNCYPLTRIIWIIAGDLHGWRCAYEMIGRGLMSGVSSR
jgi:hypothetical protein